ncbi:MAG: glycosyltransferase [Elusimicrobiota bacterium]|jgi:glycosyltransferase involved in cell wall biosynthesis|nr:glycosyltransferase [Elusimicrobiota bacterium]
MEITIITASYNCQSSIENTINSVINQTYTNWRLIVFDDGSTDNSTQIIKKYADENPKIKLLRHAGNVNKGLGETLQKALTCVNTHYVAFLECDDIWHKDYLKEKVSLLRKNPKADIIFNKVKPFGTASRVKKLSLYYDAVNFYLTCFSPFSRAYNLLFFLYSFNPVASFSCIMLRTSLLEKLDFNPAFSPWLDRWLWAQLAFKNKFYFIDKELTKWQLHPTSMTMKTLKESKNKQAAFKKQIDTLYKNNLPAYKYFFIKYLNLILNFIFRIIKTIIKHPLKFFYKN